VVLIERVGSTAVLCVEVEGGPVSCFPFAYDCPFSLGVLLHVSRRRKQRQLKQQLTEFLQRYSKNQSHFHTTFNASNTNPNLEDIAIGTITH
jgi:hypothetical protein